MNLVERNAAPAGYQLLNTRQVGRHQASDIVELAREIQTADQAIRNTATGKLTLILEQVRKCTTYLIRMFLCLFFCSGLQIKFLQSQAQRILEETEASKSIHSAACNFRKIPGTIYHMYARESGQKYISMLSPEEWGAGLTHDFQGSFRLEHDSTWTPIDRMKEVSAKNAWAQRLLNAPSAASRHKSFMAIDQSNNDEPM